MRAGDYPTVESAEFLLAALEQANDAVMIVDGDYRVSHFNAAAELIWGLDRAEVLGRDVSHLGLPDLRQIGLVPPGSSPGADSSTSRRPEVTIQRRDGSRIRSALSLSRVEAGG